MIAKELQLVPYEKLADPSTCHNLAHARNLCSILCEYERLLEEDEKVDAGYKIFLLDIIAEKKRAESDKKQKAEERDNNYYHEEKNDPQYELFLKSLKGHEKSYILEGEENGLPVFIKYEGDLSSSEKCDQEPKRKLRSAMKQDNGPSNQSKAIKKMTSRQLRNKTKSEKENYAKLSTNKREMDPDYFTVINCFKVVGDHFVLKYGDCNVAYELNDGKNNHEKEEHIDGSFRGMVGIDSKTFYEERNLNFSKVFLKDRENMHQKEEYNDGYSSDVEILQSSFCQEGNLNFSMMIEGSNFRQEVIHVLRKPYDEQEYHKLWKDIKLRRLEKRHLDLRYGREISYSIGKEGKSYLDHYPVLKRKLLEVQDDKRKCLNLLRGFFFWLQQPEPLFCPWEDTECLSITP